MAKLSSGQAPEMPAAHTKHPEGTPLLEPAALRALWFEEGDGVAVLERGEPLAVLPGWANMAKGMPGYSRDVVGQTPFGWSLDDAMEGLGPRITEASQFWRWRSDESAWPGIQQAVLGHLLTRLGPGARYWDVGGGRQPLVGVSERPPTAQRPYTVLSTVGMSCQRMPVVEQLGQDPSTAPRIELAIATTHSEHGGRPDLPVAGPVSLAGSQLARFRAVPCRGITSRRHSRSAAATKPSCCSPPPAT